MRSRSLSRNSRVVLSSYPTISVRLYFTVFFPYLRILTLGYHVISAYIGLISQVAEDLWEVENHTIRNLTKDGIDIKEYKAGLVKKSAYPPIPSLLPGVFRAGI